MFRFENLEIWQLSINYGKKLYDIADAFPKVEIYGLGSQLRRAAVSISNNIAEGSGNSSPRDFKNFLNFSVKSTLETVNIIFFAKEKNYLKENKRLELYEEAERIIRKIRAFKKSLR